ncbi:MAG: M28 family peptidase [Planctomycetota bacterium]
MIRASLLALAAGLGGINDEPADSLLASIRYLSGSDAQGRATGTEGGLAASAFVAERFAAIGLEPLGDEPGSYYRRVPGESEIPSRSVAGRVVGTAGTELSVLVTAHLDHLGEREGVLFPGANTNASGIAVMIEVARRIAADPAGASVIFVALDSEELARRGSVHFLESAPAPPGSLSAIVSFESVGRGYLGALPNLLLALDAGGHPVTGPAVSAAAEGSKLRILRASRDLLGPPLGTEPFRVLSAPQIVVTGGPHPLSYTPSDTIVTIDGERLVRVTEFGARLVRVLASQRTTGTEPLAGPVEARTIDPRAEWERELGDLHRLADWLEESLSKSEISPPRRAQIERIVRELRVVSSDPKRAPDRAAVVERLRTVLHTGRLPGGGEDR